MDYSEEMINRIRCRAETPGILSGFFHGGRMKQESRFTEEPLVEWFHIDLRQIKFPPNTLANQLHTFGIEGHSP